MLTTKEAADILEVTPRSVNNYIKDGLLTASTKRKGMGKPYYLISHTDLHVFRRKILKYPFRFEREFFAEKQVQDLFDKNTKKIVKIISQNKIENKYIVVGNAVEV